MTTPQRIGGGRSVPNLAEMREYAVNVLGTADVQYIPLYDFLLYPAGGAQQLVFFAQPLGAGVTSAPGAAGAKSINDTNLTLAGQIPAPQKFLAIGVELQFWSALAPGRTGAAAATNGLIANDVAAIARGGTLQFQIGQKYYVQDSPLGSFAQQTYLDGVSAIAEATTPATALLSTIDMPHIGGPVYEIAPVGIPWGQNFNVTLNWTAVVPLPSTNAFSRIGVKLLGFQARAAQ